MNPGIQDTFKQSVIINLDNLADRLGLLDYDCSNEFKNELINYSKSIPFPLNVKNGNDINEYIKTHLSNTQCKPDKIALLYSAVIMRYIYDYIVVNSTENTVVNPTGQYTAVMSTYVTNLIQGNKENTLVTSYLENAGPDINYTNLNKVYGLQEEFLKTQIINNDISFSPTDLTIPGFFIPSLNSINSIKTISGELFVTYGRFITNWFLKRYLSDQSDNLLVIETKINDMRPTLEYQIETMLKSVSISITDRKIILPIDIPHYTRYDQSIDYIYKLFTDIVHKTIIFFCISISRNVLYEKKNAPISIIDNGGSTIYDEGVVQPGDTSGGTSGQPTVDPTGLPTQLPTEQRIDENKPSVPPYILYATVDKYGMPIKNTPSENKQDTVPVKKKESNNIIIIVIIIVIFLVISGIIYYFINRQ